MESNPVQNNLWIYDQVRTVPETAKKPFNNGRFSGTDIKPMWRIKKLTELFGPCGIGWHTEVISERIERLDEQNIIALVDINLYIKVNGEWSMPIFGTGGNMFVQKGRISDEGFKMAYTDAISVACRSLGIGADVYWENDATKYTDAPTATISPATVSKAKIPAGSHQPVKPFPQAQGAPVKPAQPQVVTAVVPPAAPPETPPKPPQVEPVAQADDVTEEMLGQLMIRISKGKSSDERRRLSAEFKELNDGDPNFKSVSDPVKRKQLYAHFSQYDTAA